MCREAPACRNALNEATHLYPNRSRISDGICGDARHATEVSDHNPDSSGFAHAFDLTHDPANGCDAHHMVSVLAEFKDPRVKYIISQRQIWNPLRTSLSAYKYAREHGVGFFQALRSAVPGWRPYTGTNPHDKHAHVSITTEATFNMSAWWSTHSVPAPKPLPPFKTIVRTPIEIGDENMLSQETVTLRLDPYGKGRHQTDIPYAKYAGVEVRGVVKPDNQDGDAYKYNAELPDVHANNYDGKVRLYLTDGKANAQIDVLIRFIK